MVYRWRARNGDFTVWSASREETIERVKNYVAKQNKHRLTQEGVMVGWSCPYCDRRNSAHDEHVALEKFKDHLFSHKKPLMESGVHVADDIDRSGNILVKAPQGSPGIKNARIHFLAPGDIVILVTTNPAARLRLLREELGSWPALTVVLTTKDNPAEDIAGLDVSDVPIEIVKLSKRLSLSKLGNTISQVLDEHGRSEGRITVEFDILSEIIDKFGEKPAFKFLQILTNQFKTVGGIAYYPLDPTAHDESTLGLLDDSFDLVIRATETNFIADRDNR